MNTAGEVAAALRKATSPERAMHALRFFKAGPGEYAEGDKFLGNGVPQIRQIVKACKNMSIHQVDMLLTSPWHEERLAGLLILVQGFQKANEAGRKEIYDLYMRRTRYVNNWDLVDSSAEFVVGPYLEGTVIQMVVLIGLADSDLLWERRIAMLATFDYIKKGRADEALIIAERLLHDRHDLIQKAVGWMLREIGKRVDIAILTRFLDNYAATMPRTTLRYAIEHLSPERRAYYMAQKNAVKRNV